MGERSIQNYELGRNAIRMSVLKAMSGLGIDIHYLIFGSETPHEGLVNQELWDRVRAWAAATCVDESGRPMHEFMLYQRMITTYRWLQNVREPGEINERLARLGKS